MELFNRFAASQLNVLLIFATVSSLFCLFARRGLEHEFICSSADHSPASAVKKAKENEFRLPLLLAHVETDGKAL